MSHRNEAGRAGSSSAHTIRIDELRIQTAAPLDPAMLSRALSAALKEVLEGLTRSGIPAELATRRLPLLSLELPAQHDEAAVALAAADALRRELVKRPQDGAQMSTAGPEPDGTRRRLGPFTQLAARGERAPSHEPGR